jgi:hypothetical protein
VHFANSHRFVMGMKLPLEAVRRLQLEQQLSLDIVQVCAGHLGIDLLAGQIAKGFVRQALDDGFTLGRGVRTVVLLNLSHGAGFLRDAQYPQLAAMFRPDIRDDEAWRLALLQRWLDWQKLRGHVAGVPATLNRLRRLGTLLRQQGQSVVAHDPAALFHAIDPARAAMHAPAFWHEVAQIWRAAFAQIYPAAAQFQIDYACALAFCCGQYFPYDPLWQSLGDLNPEGLFSLVS